MRRSLLLSVGLGLIGCQLGWGIPNSVFGPVVQAQSPLNGVDVTEQMLAALASNEVLPGDWVDEGSVGEAEISHLLARPLMFGQEVVILKAVKRDGVLERLEATFADAGSYFGYYKDELPEGLSKKEAQELMRERLMAKQVEFSDLYQGVLEGVRAGVAAVADRDKPKVVNFGKGRTLRAEVEEWRKDELALRLFSADQRLVRVLMSGGDTKIKGWVDPQFAKESDREREARLASSVVEEDDVIRITGLQPVPQGYRPYCGLNTLAVAARHVGLHLDEDWMAAAAGFQNTGSAGGSNMVKLYHAVASEAGMSMDRQNEFDEFAVKRALSKGLPVIVWRRFSWDRNQLHDRVAKGRSPLPDPQDSSEKATWPGDDAPLHASVLTGFDGAKGEVYFLESWTGRDKPRRMSFQEMAATSYLCFVFGH